ncbi:MAG: exosortase C-terminal domain/associated protein EpsI, partial [Ginsengibacter sp.]
AWVSEDIPLSKQQLVLLGTDNTFVRKYKDPDGKAVYLYIVYSQNNRKIYHPPENCYTGGGGVSILERTLDAIPVSYKNLIIHANRLELQARQLHQITFYWFKAGDSFTSSYWKEQTLVAINSLWGKRQGSALIRISADFTGNNKEAAIREVKEFTGLITPQLMKYLP